MDSGCFLFLVRVRRTKIDLSTFKDDQVLLITGFTANEIDACREELKRRIDPFFSEEILNSRENKRIFSELTDEQVCILPPIFFVQNNFFLLLNLYFFTYLKSFAFQIGEYFKQNKSLEIKNYGSMKEVVFCLVLKCKHNTYSSMRYR